MNTVVVFRLSRILVVGSLVAASVGCGSAGRVSAPDPAVNPDVLAVYGDNVLTLEEFESRYERSVGSRNTATDDSLSEYQDFLERYVNFRLKVAAAGEAGIPDSPGVQDEIRTYRANLARPYLLEQEVMDPIVRQLYERQQEIIDASHILLRLDPSASPSDSLAAFERISAIRDSAIQGIDFGDLAQRHSEDPSATARPDGVGYRGRLGFFTAGRMVEPFESYAYETLPGDISPVFRTRFGYHILKVHGRRDALPKRRIAHIMMRPNPSAEDSAQTLAAMHELQSRIAAGESFEVLASEHSIDGQSRNRGGDLGFVGYDAPVPVSFKEAAFGIEEIGGLSDVVETPYGYHLIRWTESREPETYQEAYDELKSLATRLPRTKAAEEALARRVLENWDANVDTLRVLETFRDIAPDSVIALLTDSSFVESAASQPIMTIGDSTYTFHHLAEQARSSRPQQSGSTEARLTALLGNFVTEKAIEYEAASLERRDDEFARIMDEFRDGLVLFQFMEDSVWTAAERDTVGLETYYEAHADEYWWPDRTRIISFRSPSDSVLTGIAQMFDAGAKIAEIHDSFLNDTLNTLTIDTMLVSEPTRSVYDQALDLEPGGRTEPISFRGGYMVLVNDGVDPARQKTFGEARTQVVSDYQTIVEEQLIEKLRSRYAVRTFPERLERAFASAAQDSGAAGEVAAGE